GYLSESLVAAIKRAPASARAEYATKAKAKLRAQVQAVFDLLAKDERAWVAYLDQKDLPRPGDPGVEVGGEDNDSAPLDERVVNSIGGTYEMVVQPLFMQPSPALPLPRKIDDRTPCCSGIFPANRKRGTSGY
ncbi:MAG: hypothetical protein ABL962_20910, partial [Fimbriimonadaceae bacterium]